MIAIFTNKKTGQVELIDKVNEYNEMYNPALHKWYHVIKFKSKSLLCFESNEWRVLIRETIGKENKKWN